MNKGFIIVAVFIIGIAIVWYLPLKNNKTDSTAPQVLLSEIVDQTRFMSTDAIASRIINDDPSLLLLDVRSAYEFEEYSLPGAVNVPFETLLVSNWIDSLDVKNSDIVIFSNDDLYADQAWFLLRQEEYKNTYIMKGGLNEWFTTIMLPEKPNVEASTEAFELYSFRKGASLYFGGSIQEVPIAKEKEKVTQVKAPAPKKKVEVKQKVKKPAEGGC
jgi:rhodanese-related sulfurtransferase